MNPLAPIVAVALPVALVIAEHYAPWRQWTGHELSTYARYILGSLAVYIPASIAALFLTNNIAEAIQYVALFWTALLSAGVVVGVMRWVDNEREARHAAEDELDRKTTLYDK